MKDLWRRPWRWPVAWRLAAASFLAALGLSLYLAVQGHEVDFDVYLMGARYVFSPTLYSVQLGRSGLLFTYPPFAALGFVPFERALTLIPAQAVWTVGSVASLTGLLAVSIRVARPELGRGSVWRAALLLTLPSVFLNPVFITIGFGQVNILLTLLVLWDLAGPRRIGSRTVPLGVATGIAAAIKLTPLIFVPYLILTRRVRGGATCLVTFCVCEAATFLVSPSSSLTYWTKDVFDSTRAGGLFYISDQNLRSMLERFHHALVPGTVLWPLTLLVGAGGLWLAALAHRRSSSMLGILVCATTGLVISPITWVHHIVWVVPAIVWLAVADDRPRFGRYIAVGTAVLFWAAPIWWVPHKNLRELHEDGWQLVAGNSFFCAMFFFLAGTALLLAQRARRRGPALRPG